HKEFSILLKNSGLNENNFKKYLNNNVILLKGSTDVIISKNKVLFNKTGNEGMSKAGTGDVLAGLTAGFLAQSKDLQQSAINAAYFNGLIGDILMKKKKGFSFLASDMVEEIKKLV
ncbi:MAG: NAD(P)H-hydrate dehydratase, partial [Candidatus Woesearchaeota archaeon]|nr:NAD(P)H-hydrate dehydratase [Candidatus Woesearchaeota archaeon]